MTDILAKDNRLQMYDGDFQLVNHIEEIKQQIIVALNTFYADWLLDYRKGIDYVFGLRHEEFLQHDCKNQIMGVKGVLSVIKLNMNFDRNTFTTKITACIKTVYGTIEVNPSIKQ